MTVWTGGLLGLCLWQQLGGKCLLLWLRLNEYHCVHPFTDSSRPLFLLRLSEILCRISFRKPLVFFHGFRIIIHLVRRIFRHTQDTLGLKYFLSTYTVIYVSFPIWGFTIITTREPILCLKTNQKPKKTLKFYNLLLTHNRIITPFSVFFTKSFCTLFIRVHPGCPLTSVDPEYPNRFRSYWRGSISVERPVG